MRLRAPGTVIAENLSDAFIVLPGGIGTIEEFFEVYTWYQLGIHLKPFGLLNIRSYFSKLLEFVEHMVGEGFLKPAHRNVGTPERRAQDSRVSSIRLLIRPLLL